MNLNDATYDFYPDGFLDDLDDNPSSTKTILLVPNIAIDDRETFTKLWLKAELRICADGGANRLFDLYEASPEFRDAFLPSAIAGDLDSIRPDVRIFYEARGVPIREDKDQYATDCKKCLDWILEEGVPRLRSSSDASFRLSLIVYGSLAGRVDQAFSLLHHLFMARERLGPSLGGGQIYMIGAESITLLLSNKKRNQIFLRPFMGVRTCGILPAAPGEITTHGLKWDVEKWQTSIEGQMSTSNHVKDDVVEIFTTEPAFFTVELMRETVGVDQKVDGKEM